MFSFTTGSKRFSFGGLLLNFCSPSSLPKTGAAHSSAKRVNNARANFLFGFISLLLFASEHFPEKFERARVARFAEHVDGAATHLLVRMRARDLDEQRHGLFRRAFADGVDGLHLHLRLRARTLHRPAEPNDDAAGQSG